MESNRLCYMILQYMKRRNNPRSWWGKMKDKLSELSIPVDYLLNHQFNEVKYVINQKVMVQEQQRWTNEVQKKPKLNFYQKNFGFRSLPIADQINLRQVRSFCVT